jgi:hypothetical protein
MKIIAKNDANIGVIMKLLNASHFFLMVDDLCDKLRLFSRRRFGFDQSVASRP